MSTNFHLGSGPAHSVPPCPPMSNGIPPPPVSGLSSSHMPSGLQSQQSIHVDGADNDDEVRTTKRLVWLPDEDRRLVRLYTLICTINYII